MIKAPTGSLEIIVLDPGLREFGGHHPATMLGLPSLFKKHSQVSFRVYCHKNLDSRCVFELEKNNIKVEATFSTDFYQDFYLSKSYSQTQVYIRNLAKEYIDMISLYADANVEGKLLLFHTLNWQHAAALSICLRYLKTKYSKLPRIFVFLMYSPIQERIKGKSDPLIRNNFSISFRSLYQNSFVTMFASDDEIAASFQSILTINVPIHPCYLINTISTPEVINSEDRKTIILFAGDAKENKGFLDLPELITQVINDEGLKNCEFYIHYTLTNDKPSLLAIDKKVTDIVSEAKTKKINLSKSFMSDYELNIILQKASAIIFNYDEQIYKFQSSGLLWKAAYYRLKVLLLSDTWLNRESIRLNLQVKQTTLTQASSQLNSLISSAQSKKQNAYASVLFQDFSSWLLDEYSKGI